MVLVSLASSPSSSLDDSVTLFLRSPLAINFVTSAMDRIPFVIYRLMYRPNAPAIKTAQMVMEIR